MIGGAFMCGRFVGRLKILPSLYISFWSMSGRSSQGFSGFLHVGKSDAWAIGAA
jgi:hypothetical protein